jgi:hypothetical protein
MSVVHLSFPQKQYIHERRRWMRLEQYEWPSGAGSSIMGESMEIMQMDGGEEHGNKQIEEA